MPGATSSSRRRSGSETLCPDGLLGLAMNTTSGRRSTIGGDRGVDVEAEVVGAGRLEPFGAGAVGDDRVHRVGRDEPDRGAPRPAERLQQLLQDLVGTVCSPEVFDAKPDAGLRAEVGGQVPAQRHRVAVGVAMQVGGRLAHRCAPRRRPAPWSAGAGSRWCSAAPEPPVVARRRAICHAGRRAAAARQRAFGAGRVIARTSAAPPRRARAGLRPRPA